MSGQPEPDYRLYVNAKRTIYVRFWKTGKVEVAMRDDPGHIWGPPVPLREDRP